MHGMAPGKARESGGRATLLVFDIVLEEASECICDEEQRGQHEHRALKGHGRCWSAAFFLGEELRRKNCANLCSD